MRRRKTKRTLSCRELIGEYTLRLAAHMLQAEGSAISVLTKPVNVNSLREALQEARHRRDVA